MVMPQGLKTAANFWNRIVQHVFLGAPPTIQTYQDDIIVGSADAIGCFRGQQEAYDRLRDSHLVFKRTKSSINHPRMKILGHIVTSRGRIPDVKKVQAILDMGMPKTPSEVKHFLGMVGYNKDYVHRLSELTAVLYDVSLVGADIASQWRDDTHGAAVREIQRQLSIPTVLLLPDPLKSFRVEVA